MTADRLIDLDRRITLWLNGWHSSWSDQFWMFLSDTRIWFPLYGFIMVLLVWKLGWRRGLVVILSCILTVVLADQISYHVKNGVMRLRPCYTTWMIENGLYWPLPRRGLYGFFSGHASNAFSFVACSLAGFRVEKAFPWRAYAWTGFIWATLVALSRVMLAAHYVGDILVGAAFGLAVGFAIGYATRLLTSRISAKRISQE